MKRLLFLMLTLFAQTTLAINVDELTEEVIQATNIYRQQNGLDVLTFDEACSQASQAHAEDLATNGYFSHYGLDGSSPRDRYNRYNKSGQRVVITSENIATGNNINAQDAMRMWTTSAGHRANLLRNVHHIGVGVAEGQCKWGGSCVYFVQCFSRY